MSRCPWSEHGCFAAGSDSAPQKADPAGPVQGGGLAGKSGEGVNQAPDIGRGYGLFVDEDDAAMGLAGLGPGFEQRRNGAPVVGDQRPMPLGCTAQASPVVLTDKTAA